MIKISRPDMLERLVQFSQTGHGLVVGKPGVGKSYLIDEMASSLIAQEIPAIVIKIDRLYEVTNAEINGLLDLEDWIAHLGTIDELENNKPVLIFDAFDAARDETKRQRILSIIRQAKNTLDEKWNILVSVRVYDADKSEELARLFGSENEEGFAFPAKRFYINELTPLELNVAVRDHSFLKTIVDFGNEKLNEILRIPFYLVLLDSIAEIGGDELGEIRQMRSEIELLNKFWFLKAINRAESIDLELLAQDFAVALASNRVLSLPRNTFLGLANLKQETMQYLESENVITVEKNFGGKASFSHNIFFDYFVGRYALPADLKELDTFMRGDLSRVFFLRPSFIYYFSNEWFTNCSAFWRAYRQFIFSDHGGIKLFARLAFNSIIASEYQNINQLSPIIEEPDRAQRAEMIRYLLQAIRFIRGTTSLVDVNLYTYLSHRLQIEYSNDFGFLVDRAVRDEYGNEEFKLLGITARKFLAYTMTEAKKGYKEFFDRLAASFGVEVVCRTFSSGIDESRESLRQVLELLTEDNFQINYITSLSEYVRLIIPVDPEFVGEVYLAVFAHEEKSDDRTQMHAGVTMSFTSNRRQDYEMCYYRLITHFPQLMAKDPFFSLIIGIRIVNQRVVQEHLEPYSIEPCFEPFEYGDLTVIYFSDTSAVWGENAFGFEESKFIDNILATILSAKGDKDLFKKYVLEYLKECQCAYTWKRLFGFAASYTQEFKALLLPLLSFKILVTHPDTSYEVREFVRNVVPFLDNNEVMQIEEVAMEHYEGGSNPGPLILFLSQIPVDRSQSSKVKDFFTSNTRLEANIKPFEFSSSSGEYTTEMLLEERGVDVTDIHNKELTNYIREFDRFNIRFMNGIPIYEESKDILDLTIKVYARIVKERPAIAPLLFSSVLRAIAQSCAILSRIIEKFNANEFDKLKEIVLFAYGYVTDADKDQEKNNPLHGYGPTAKIEAAEAIPHLFRRTASAEDEKLLRDALEDKSIIIRFKVVRHLRDVVLSKSYDLFWTLLIERLEKETNGFVYSLLLGNIQIRRETNREQIDKILSIIEAKRDSLISDTSFRDSYTETLLWFLANFHNEYAKNVLKGAANTVEFCNNIIFKTFDKLHPSYPDNDFIEGKERYADVIEIMRFYISHVSSVFSSIEPGKLNFDIPEVKDSFSIINQMILRIYFQISERQVAGRRGRIVSPVNEDNRRAFYFLVKPIYEDILAVSAKVNGTGLMTGPSAYYFTQSFNIVLHYDVRFILSSVLQIARYAEAAGFAMDASALGEIVKLTEKLFADFRYLLQDSEPFSELVELLEIFARAGWIEALKLLWKLDEVFK